MSDHCDCGHDHGHEHHNHELGHEHHHHKHEDEAEAFAESALKKSARRVIFLDTPSTIKEVLAKKITILTELAECIAFEDIILGHIKALVDFGEQKVSISITRLDECDRSFDEYDDCVVTSYIITVNVLSLYNTELELNDLMEKLLTE